MSFIKLLTETATYKIDSIFSQCSLCSPEDCICEAFFISDKQKNIKGGLFTLFSCLWVNISTSSLDLEPTN